MRRSPFLGLLAIALCAVSSSEAASAGETAQDASDPSIGAGVLREGIVPEVAPGSAVHAISCRSAGYRRLRCSFRSATLDGDVVWKGTVVLRVRNVRRSSFRYRFAFRGSVRNCLQGTTPRRCGSEDFHPKGLSDRVTFEDEV